MQKLFWLAVLGAIGTLARYGMAGWVQRLSDANFPLGTLAVNTIGSFLFGLIWSIAEERALISTEARILLLTGFMGAFTTFSTFMFETGMLIRDTQWVLAFGNVAAQLFVGLLCLFAGFALGHLV